MNYRFNIDEWLPRFPLQEQHGHYRAEIIASPWHLCQNEQLRREMCDEFDWGPAVPMDVFVMAKGEPPDRHVTKIGGLPYWPADADWPTMPDGTPMVFLGQVNFCDSEDLTGDLPGDILLVFADQVYTPECLGFEWYDMGLPNLIGPELIPTPPSAFDVETDLMQRELLKGVKELGHGFLDYLPQSLPEPTNVFAPCYGHVFRTVSYPKAKLRNASVNYPSCRERDVYSEFRVPCYQATQIGAAPFYIQEGDPCALPGRPLCTINSVEPAFDVAFPWINRETPIPLEAFKDHDKYLMIGDMGCLYISIDEAGEVHGHWSDY